MSSTVNTPWASAITATDGVHTARHLGDGDVTTYTALSAGGNRVTETTTSHDSYGRVTSVDDLGDTSTSNDDTCTTTSYADNTSAWLMNYPSEVIKVGRTCTQTAVLPGDAISDTRSYYDNLGWGAAPTKGDVTGIVEAKSYTGATPNWLTVNTTTYDALGRPLVTTDNRTGATRTTTNSYVPSATGPLTSMSVTNTLGWTTTTAYQPAWNLPLTITDQNGKVTTETYDPLGRRSKIWLPDEPTTAAPSMSFTYNISNTAPSYVTTSAPNSGGTSTSYTIYDGLMRQRQTQTDSEGGGTIVTDTQYDDAGQAIVNNSAYWTNTVNPSGTLFIPQSQQQIPSQTQTSYDGAGRVTKTLLMSLGFERYHTAYAYGGDHVDTTPPAGGTATGVYTDALGRTTKLLQYQASTPTGAADATTYSYDHAGHMTSMNDPAGDQWTWTFDALGQLHSSSDPDTGTTTNSYDDAGRLTSTTSAARQTSTAAPAAITLAYSYDSLDRKTGEFLGSTSGPQLAAWVYDPTIGGTQVKGELASSTSYVGSTATVLGTAYTKSVNGYDADYRVTSASVTIPNTTDTGTALANTYTTTFSYGPDGQLISQGDPLEANLPAESMTYSYSVLGHKLALATGAAFYYNSTSYTHINQLAQYNRPGTHSNFSTYGYDLANGNITEIKDTNQTGSTSTLAADRVYAYNDAGNVTSATDSPTGVAVDAQCYTYDYLQRLTQAWTTPAAGACGTNPTGPSSIGGPAPYWQTYTYDKLGNRLTDVKHATTTGAATLTDTYSYPTPGLGVSQPHIPTQITHTSSTGTPATSTSPYVSDAAGDATTRSGQNLTYTAEGKLQSVTAGSQTQHNIYDADGNLLLQVDPTGTTAFLGDSQLHRNPGATTATGQRIYSTPSGTPIAERTSAGGFWLDTDRTGTVTVTTSASTGTATRRHDDPFGNTRDASPPSWVDSRNYLNQPVTALTGLTHLGARDYDPVLGRFLTADPLLDPMSPQQNNGYSYANNSPITLTDASGLRPEGDTGDTDAGDWGTHTTCPSCSNPAPQFGPSDGWTSVDTKTVMITYKTRIPGRGHRGVSPFKTHTISLYDLMHPSPGPKNYCGSWSWACTMIGYNQLRNCIASPSVGECVGAAIALVSDVTLAGAAVKLSTLVADAAIQLGAKSAESVIDVTAEEVTGEAADTTAELKPTAGQTIYRVYGGDSKAEGASWSPVNPSSVSNFRDAAGLPSGGASGATNTGRFVIQGTLRDPAAVVVQRSALPLDGMKGGLPEYIIPGWSENGSVSVGRVSGVNPEF